MNKSTLNNYRQLYNGVHYCPGQVVRIYEQASKTYKTATVITAGGGKVKVKDKTSIYWVDARGVK